MPSSLEAATTAGFLALRNPTLILRHSQSAQQRVRIVRELLTDPTFSPPQMAMRFITATAAPFETCSIEEFILSADDTDLEEIGADEPTTRADDAIFQLCRFEQFKDNWDGSGAARPIAASLADARRFIRSLAPESEIPRPALHADGRAILFLRDKDKYAELEFLGDSKIGYYARMGGEEWGDDITFDGRTLPQELSNIGLIVGS